VIVVNESATLGKQEDTPEDVNPRVSSRQGLDENLHTATLKRRYDNPYTETTSDGFPVKVFAKSACCHEGERRLRFDNLY